VSLRGCARSPERTDVSGTISGTISGTLFPRAESLRAPRRGGDILHGYKSKEAEKDENDRMTWQNDIDWAPRDIQTCNGETKIQEPNPTTRTTLMLSLHDNPLPTTPLTVIGTPRPSWSWRARFPSRFSRKIRNSSCGTTRWQPGWKVNDDIL